VALLKKRVARTSAVTIDRPSDDTTLSSIMKKVTAQAKSTAIGAVILNTRKTKAGGILLEVDAPESACTLAEKLKEIVGDAARVRVPQRKTPVLLLNVPDWVDEEEVKGSLIQAGVAPQELVRGDRNSITLRTNTGGRGARVARLDVSYPAALTLAGAGHVTIGLTRCKVKLLERSQITCFRCQDRGHIAAECKGPDRPRRCYRCHTEGHLASACKGPAKKETDHRKTQEAT